MTTTAVERRTVGNVVYVRFPHPKKRRAIPAAVRRCVAARDQGANGKSAWCHYCGARGEIQWTTWVRFKGLELDHVIPVELGGTNHPDNIVLACQRCNRSKGWRRTAEEMAWRKR